LKGAILVPSIFPPRGGTERHVVNGACRVVDRVQIMMGAAIVMASGRCFL